MEHHRKADSLPAVEVMITKGEEDICIKVSYFVAWLILGWLFHPSVHPSLKVLDKLSK